MTYQEAKSVSDVCLGYIKCTYAEIFDKDGNKLFSLQAANVGDVPVVVTDGTADVAEQKNVPVRLTTDALASIARSLKIRKEDRNYRKLVDAVSKKAYVKHAALVWLPETKEVKQEVEVKKQTSPITLLGLATTLWYLFK